MPRPKRPTTIRRKACYFEINKVEPTFTDTAILRRFLTERGKIVAAAKSGVCAKHQRALATEVKRARQVGLLPYVS